MVGIPLGSVTWGFLLAVSWFSPAVDVEVAPDAAGPFGFREYFQGFWFTGRWAASQLSQSIAHKELFPVVVAAHVWGSQWS